MTEDNLEIVKSDNSIIIDHTNKIEEILIKYNIPIEFITDDTILSFGDVVSEQLGLSLPSALSEIRAYLIQKQNPDILETHIGEGIGIIHESAHDDYIPNLNVMGDIEFPEKTKYEVCAACEKTVEHTAHTYCLNCQLPVHANCGYKVDKKHFCSEECLTLYIENEPKED
jgi:hypothetical protein